MKQQPGKDLVIFGGAGITQTFMQLGLIDEHYPLFHHIVLGRGKPLFEGIHDQLNLKLLKTKVFGSGVVLLD
jgi:dihydrofolate reductase